MKIAWAVMGVCLLVLTGCATTERVAIEDQTTICRFLGEACHQLAPGGEGQLGLRWPNPKANWTRYNKVMIDVVGFYGSDPQKVSPKDQQMLVDVFQKALHEELAKKFQIETQPVPNTIRIQVVILDAEAATPGVRTLSMAIPQARILSVGAYAVTGKYPFVGGLEGAIKLTDAVTGEILGVGADRRVGGGSAAAAAQWQWGDAENVCEAWAQNMAEKLSDFTSGKAKP